MKALLVEYRSILYKFLCVLLASAMLLFTACSSVQIVLPAITDQESDDHHVGRVIWHDLLTNDSEVSKQFYGELFGWEFSSVPLQLSGRRSGEYNVITHQGRLIGGMVDTSLLSTSLPLVQWVSILSVSDIDQSLDSVRASGGKVFGAPVDLGDRGIIAVAEDSQGGLFGMLQTSKGDPEENSPLIGDFLWDELWTTDTQQASSFYQQVFAYTVHSETLSDDDNYLYFSSQDKPRMAIIDNPIEGLKPTWVSYIRVADVGATLARVESLGGEILVPTRANPLGGELAIIRDPDGSGFVIQTWDN